MSLLNRHPVKLQNQISHKLLKEVSDLLGTWLIESGLPSYEAGLLADELVDMAYKDQIKRTAPTAPNVDFSDRIKRDRLFSAAQALADQLDRTDALENLMKEIVERGASEPGNSI